MKKKKEFEVRRIQIREIESLHPTLAGTLDDIDTQHLLPDEALTKAGIEELLESNPIPVSYWGESYVALGEPRLLHAARIHFRPSSLIPVLDCSRLDNEATENLIRARYALNHLYSAHHPRDFARAADAIRSALPMPLREQWCPALKTQSRFAECVGVDRKIFSPPRKKNAKAAKDQTGLETPLDRIRKGVHGE